MSTICADQHKLYSSHQLFSPRSPSSSSSSSSSTKPFEIPPRKQLFTKKLSQEDYLQSPDMSPYEASLLKYLPYNGEKKKNDCDDDDDDDLDPYSSDHFRMYEFKVRRCTRSRSHDWTDCPFAHPGEKARRRDPRRYHYSGAVCPEFRRGGCSRGDNCEFAHGVFECWLHPSRYRTEACKDGKNCKRKVCFFAHSPKELRILPEVSCGSRKYDASALLSPSSLNRGHCCCLVCHSVASSPTSTLLGMSHISPPLSPSLSPPLSPVKHRSRSGFSPFSRYGDSLSKLAGSGVVSYKDVLTELMSSLEAMNVAEAAAAAAANNRNITNSSTTPAWVDVSLINNTSDQDQQQQFILSPSTPNPVAGGRGNFFNGDCSSTGSYNTTNHYKINNSSHGHDNNGLASPDPDFGWVNELLM